MGERSSWPERVSSVEIFSDFGSCLGSGVLVEGCAGFSFSAGVGVEVVFSSTGGVGFVSGFSTDFSSGGWLGGTVEGCSGVRLGWAGGVRSEGLTEEGGDEFGWFGWVVSEPQPPNSQAPPTNPTTSNRHHTREEFVGCTLGSFLLDIKKIH